MDARSCCWPKASILVHSFLLLAALLAFQVVDVQADLGPKPSMDFSFTYEVTETPILSGQLMECSDESCSDAHPMQEIAIQRFSCSEYECYSQAYGYPDYLQLVIQFADRSRHSNVFNKKAFNASFTVTVYEGTLEVKENFRISSCCDCLNLWLTLVIETIVASIYMAAFHLPRAFVGWIPLASILTLPFVWLGFPLLPLPSIANTGVSEIFAVVVETGFLHVCTFKRISLPQAFLLSLVMNMVSFGIGLLI